MYNNVGNNISCIYLENIFRCVIITRDNECLMLNDSLS